MKQRSDNKSGFTGVYFEGYLPKRPWVAQIRLYGKRYTLGRYATAERASIDYQQAAKARVR